jgi:Mg2+-importing ATPase
VLLVAVTLWVAAAGLAKPYLGAALRAFGFTPLSLLDLLSLMEIVLAYVIATEAGKRRFFSDLARRRKRAH